MNIPFRFINNDDEERINPFLTDFQRQREGQVSELFTNYINLYNKREKNKNLFRGILFWFCIVLAAIIIGVSLWMLHIWLPIMAGQYTATPTTTATVNEATPAPSTEGFRLERLLFSVAEATSDDENGTTEETTPPKDTTNNSSGTVKDYIDSVLASNASTAAKDIVAIISVCITILGSIFGLLRMIAIYVLPKDEEKNMQEIVKMIHENDFKDVVVRMLYAKERYEEIVKYLKLPETPGKPDDPNKKDSKP